MPAKAGGAYRLTDRGYKVVSKYNASVSDVLVQQEKTIMELSEQNLKLLSGWRPDEQFYKTVGTVVYQSCIAAQKKEKP